LPCWYILDRGPWDETYDEEIGRGVDGVVEEGSVDTSLDEDEDEGVRALDSSLDSHGN
jgi:hypothetical protein